MSAVLARGTALFRVLEALMPDGDTAEFGSEGTAPLESDAPPLEEATEAAPDEGETETAPTDDTTETADPLDTLDDDTLKKHPKVAALLEATAKDVEARKEESARQRIAQERLRAEGQRHATDLQYQSSDQFIEDLAGIVAKAELDDNGRPILDRNTIKQLNGLNVRQGATLPVTAMQNLMADVVGPEFKQTDTERASQEAAWTHFYQTLDSGPLFRHWLNVATRATSDTQRESLRREVEAEVRRDIEAKAEADRAEAAKSKRGPQPTTVNGGPVRTARPTNAFEALNQQLASSDLEAGRKALAALGVSIN